MVWGCASKIHTHNDKHVTLILYSRTVPDAYYFKIFPTSLSHTTKHIITDPSDLQDEPQVDLNIGIKCVYPVLLGLPSIPGYEYLTNIHST